MSAFVGRYHQHRTDLSPYDSNINGSILGNENTSTNHATRADSSDIFQSRENQSISPSPIFKSEKKNIQGRGSIFSRPIQPGYPNQESKLPFRRTYINSSDFQSTVGTIRVDRLGNNSTNNQGIFSSYSQLDTLNMKGQTGNYQFQQDDNSVISHNNNNNNNAYHTPKKNFEKFTYEGSNGSRYPQIVLDEESISFSSVNQENNRRQRPKRINPDQSEVDTYLPSMMDTAKNRNMKKIPTRTSIILPAEELSQMQTPQHERNPNDQYTISPVMNGTNKKKFYEKYEVDSTSMYYPPEGEEKEEGEQEVSRELLHEDEEQQQQQQQQPYQQNKTLLNQASRARRSGSVNHSMPTDSLDKLHAIIQNSAKKKEWINNSSQVVNDFEISIPSSPQHLESALSGTHTYLHNNKVSQMKRNEYSRNINPPLSRIERLSNSLHYSTNELQLPLPSSQIQLPKKYPSIKLESDLSNNTLSNSKGLSNGIIYDLYTQKPTGTFDFGNQTINQPRGIHRKREVRSISSQYGHSVQAIEDNLDNQATTLTNFGLSDNQKHKSINNSPKNTKQERFGDSFYLKENENNSKDILDSEIFSHSSKAADSRSTANALRATFTEELQQKHNEFLGLDEDQYVPSLSPHNNNIHSHGDYQKPIKKVQKLRDNPLKNNLESYNSNTNTNINKDTEDSIRSRRGSFKIRDPVLKNVDRKQNARSVVDSRTRNSFKTTHTGTGEGFHQVTTPSANRLAKSTIRIQMLEGGETVEVQDFSLIPPPKDSKQKFQDEAVIRINIKNILEMETYMEQVSEDLNSNSYSYIVSSKKLLSLIFEDPKFNINQAYRFFNDEKLSRVGKILNVLELVSIYLIVEIGKTQRNQIQSFYPQMKSLIYYIHQSFLIFWDLLYLLFNESIEDKDCLGNLRSRIEEKRQDKLGQKKSSYHHLKQNYDILTKLIQPLIKELRDVSTELQQLFKICEDQSTIQIFNAIREIFQKQPGVINEGETNSPGEQMKGTTNAKSPSAFKGQVRNVKPFLPPCDILSKPFTLVLDLDETLIHYFEARNAGTFLTRPFCEKFLRELSRIYEIVIFTAGTEEYANWVLDLLDKNRFIKFRLSRQHTDFNNGVYVKDLTKIGREVSKTIIIDNVPENFRLQKENGISIRSWYNDRSDTALRDLIPILTEVAQTTVDDVRPQLKRMRIRYPPKHVKYLFDLPI